MSYLNIRKKLNKYIKLQPGGTLEYLKPQTMGLSITPDSSGLANLGADGSVSVNQDVLDEQLDQVADNIDNLETLERELKPLDNINDHNPEYLLTTDYTPYTSHNRIK